MDFDNIDTNSISAQEGELDQLLDIMGKDKRISANKLVIETESGRKLIVDSSAGYSEIEVSKDAE